MTRSLALLIQIVLHAIPAAIMGTWISSWFFDMMRDDVERESIPSVPLYVLVLGCLLASTCLVSLGSRAILSGSRRYATFCAFGVPFLAATPWLALHMRGDFINSFFFAGIASIISCIASLVVQSAWAPSIAKKCKVACERAASAKPGRRDPFAIPLLVLLHAIPGCYLALCSAWAAPSVPSKAAAMLCGAFILASCLWVNTLSWYLRGRSLRRQAAAGAACGVLVPLFAAVAVAIWHQGLPAVLAMSLSLGRIAPLLAFTIPAQALLTPLASAEELDLKVVIPSHA